MSGQQRESVDMTPAAATIDLPSIPEVIYHQLRRDLARGVYKPGPIRIRPLAERFGVSATPVREALRRLEAEGLVTLRKNQIVVNSLSEPELREIYAIRAELEAFAVRRGAETIKDDAEVLRVLESLVSAMDQYENQPEEWLTANQNFHMLIYRAACMPRLSSMIESLCIATEPYLRLYASGPRRLRASQEEHRSMLQSLKGGDGEGAAQALRRHLAKTEELVAAGVTSDDVDKK